MMGLGRGGGPWPRRESGPEGVLKDCALPEMDAASALGFFLILTKPVPRLWTLLSLSGVGPTAWTHSHTSKHS